MSAGLSVSFLSSPARLFRSDFSATVPSTRTCFPTRLPSWSSLPSSRYECFASRICSCLTTSGCDEPLVPTERVGSFTCVNTYELVRPPPFCRQPVRLIGAPSRPRAWFELARSPLQADTTEASATVHERVSSRLTEFRFMQILLDHWLAGS